MLLREPTQRETFVVAAFTGNKHFTGGIQWNHNGVWFPHKQLVAAIQFHNPDLLFFSGDQIYEADLTGAQRIDQPFDANGENIALVAEDIQINALVSSTGGTLTLHPRDRDGTIGIGDGATGDFLISQAELDLLRNGFGQIIIGNASGRFRITIGNSVT